MRKYTLWFGIVNDADDLLFDCDCNDADDIHLGIVNDADGIHFALGLRTMLMIYHGMAGSSTSTCND